MSNMSKYAALNAIARHSSRINKEADNHDLLTYALDNQNILGDELVRNRRLGQYTLGAGLGALGGAGAGTALAGKDNKTEGAVYGALVGTPLGLLLTQLAQERKWV